MIVSVITGVLSVAVPAMFGWLWKLGDRQTKSEALHQGLRELIEARFDRVDDHITDVKYRVGRIEQAMNGTFKH